jgi:hypothetical protein
MRKDMSNFETGPDTESCCVYCHREIQLSELQQDLGIISLLDEYIEDPETDGCVITCCISWNCNECGTPNNIEVTVRGHDELWYEDDNRVRFEGYSFVEVERFEVV